MFSYERVVLPSSLRSTASLCSGCVLGIVEVVIGDSQEVLGGIHTMGPELDGTDVSVVSARIIALLSSPVVCQCPEYVPRMKHHLPSVHGPIIHQAAVSLQNGPMSRQ